MLRGLWALALFAHLRLLDFGDGDYAWHRLLNRISNDNLDWSKSQRPAASTAIRPEQEYRPERQHPTEGSSCSNVIRAELDEICQICCHRGIALQFFPFASCAPD